MRAVVTVAVAVVWTAALLVVSALGVVVAILVLPLDYRLRLQTAGGAVQWQASFRWAWGAVAGRAHGVGVTPEFDLRLAGLRLRADGWFRRRPRRSGPPPRRVRGRRRRQRSIRRALRRVVWPDLLKALLRGVRRLWRSLGLRVRGDLRYGWEDPALTGLTQGLLAAMPRTGDIRLTASYTEPGLAGWVEVTGRLVPVRMVGAVLRTLWELPVRRVWWGEVKDRLRAFRRRRRRRPPRRQGRPAVDGTGVSANRQSA